MEDLARFVKFLGVLVLCCVFYAIFKLADWLIGLAGICIGACV